MDITVGEQKTVNIEIKNFMKSIKTQEEFRSEEIEILPEKNIAVLMMSLPEMASNGRKYTGYSLIAQWISIPH